MELFMQLFNALPGSISQGLVWGIMAIGIYITYRILDVADLTVDGSFATGGAVAVVLILNGWNLWLAMLVAFIAGLIAGAITGLLHTLMSMRCVYSLSSTTSESAGSDESRHESTIPGLAIRL